MSNYPFYTRREHTDEEIEQVADSLRQRIID